MLKILFATIITLTLQNVMGKGLRRLQDSGPDVVGLNEGGEDINDDWAAMPPSDLSVMPGGMDMPGSAPVASPGDGHVEPMPGDGHVEAVADYERDGMPDGDFEAVADYDGDFEAVADYDDPQELEDHHDQRGEEDTSGDDERDDRDDRDEDDPQLDIPAPVADYDQEDHHDQTAHVGMPASRQEEDSGIHDISGDDERDDRDEDDMNVSGESYNEDDWAAAAAMNTADDAVSHADNNATEVINTTMAAMNTTDAAAVDATVDDAVSHADNNATEVMNTTMAAEAAANNNNESWSTTDGGNSGGDDVSCQWLREEYTAKSCSCS